MPLNKAYEPKNIILEIGSSIAEDFAPESLIRLERNEEDFSFSNGVRLRNNNRSGIITFSLLESSLTNKILRNYLKADREFNRGTFPLIFKDRNNNVLHRVDSAWVADTHGYPESGIKSGERIWVLQAGAIEDESY